MSSLPTLALKSPNFHMVFKEFMKHVPVSRSCCLSHHQFYFLLEHECSEEYDTRYYVWHPITNKLNPLNCWYDYLMHKKTRTLFMTLNPLSIEKCVFSHRFGATASPQNLIYLTSSLETVIREPALYKLLTFHNPNLISIFCCLDHLSKESFRVRGSCKLFVTNLFFTVKGC
jgi:hypothetical protein